MNADHKPVVVVAVVHMAVVAHTAAEAVVVVAAAEAVHIGDTLALHHTLVAVPDIHIPGSS